MFLYRHIRKYLSYRHLLEKHDAEDLQDFAKTLLKPEFFLDKGHQHIHADGNPNLGLDGIDAGAEKGFDAQILLDPFEEQFDLPATFVHAGKGQGRQDKVVG